MTTKNAAPMKNGTGSRIACAKSIPVSYSSARPHKRGEIDLAIAEELVLVTLSNDDEGTFPFISPSGISLCFCDFE